LWVRLEPASPGPVTVSFRSLDGSALAGRDYASVNGVLQFAPGETEKVIQVTALPDVDREGVEQFQVELFDAQGAGMRESRGTVHILDGKRFRDADGDGKADIVWRHSGGALFIWLMDGRTLRGGTYLDPISLDWEIQGVGDFNGDGHQDLFWRHRTTGSTYIWMMNGPTVIGGTGYTSAQAGNGWRVEAFGDFDGDGKTDVLWRELNTSLPRYYTWLLDGVSVRPGGFAFYEVPGSVLGWSVKAAADFDGDGTDDMLWRQTGSNTNGLYLWRMQAGKVVFGGFLEIQPDATWQIATAGDFDGDGYADIVWRHTSGALFIWLMNGRRIKGATWLDPISLDWEIQGSADFTGDGKFDLLWREKQTGNLYLWAMDGPTVIGGTGYPNHQADWTWKVQVPR
jgi:hypothetical protein